MTRQMTLFQGLLWKWYSWKRSFVEMVFRGNAFGEMGFGKKGFGDVAVRRILCFAHEFLV